MRQTEWKRVAATARQKMAEPDRWIIGRHVMVHNPARWVLFGVLLESLTARERLLPLASPLFVPTETVILGHEPRNTYVESDNAAKHVVRKLSAVASEQETLTSMIEVARKPKANFPDVEIGAYAAAILNDMRTFRQLLADQRLVKDPTYPTPAKLASLDQRRARVAHGLAMRSRSDVLTLLDGYREVTAVNLRRNESLADLVLEPIV